MKPLLAAFVVAASIAVGGVAAAQVVPEAVEGPRIEDECLCGGGGYAIGACEHIPYWGWYQLYWNGTYITYKPCIAGDA